MSNEFYNYVANSIINYFQLKQDRILPGERFCLRLDNEEILVGVNEALRKISEERNIQGQYSYEDVYTTFTVKISIDTEFVIAAKINMEEDFLAKLRNIKRTDKDYPILMLTTQSALDTITSGTADLSANGMPFHSSMLLKQIDENIETAQLSVFDQAIMRTELEHKKNDRYSDKSSLYEYRELLTVLERGYVVDNDYSDFGMFVDPEAKNWVDYNKSKERIEKNRAIFEKIDRIYKHGDIEEQLSKEFDKPLVDSIVQAKKKGTSWYEGFTYQMICTSMDKMRRKLDNPLEILDSDFLIYSGSPLEHSFIIDETAFIRSDGKTKAQQRKKNILIYNHEQLETITIQIATNITVKQSWVETWGATAIVSGKQVKIEIDTKDCTFAQVNIKDLQNNITYQIKICIVGVSNNYLDQIRTAYMLYISKKKLQKSKIQVMGIEKELVINPGKENEMVVSLHNGGEYECNYNQTLHLKLEEDEIDTDTGKADCTIKCGSVFIPIEIQDEPVKPIELTGATLFKWKNNKKRSLEHRAGNLLYGTEKYFVREPLRASLLLEELLIKNGWLALSETESGYVEYPLSVSENVKAAYTNLTQELSKRNIVPSSAYYVGKLRELALEYLEAVKTEIFNIQEGQLH